MIFEKINISIAITVLLIVIIFLSMATSILEPYKCNIQTYEVQYTILDMTIDKNSNVYYVYAKENNNCVVKKYNSKDVDIVRTEGNSTIKEQINYFIVNGDKINVIVNGKKVKWEYDVAEIEGKKFVKATDNNTYKYLFDKINVKDNQILYASEPHITAFVTKNTEKHLLKNDN